MRVVDLATKTLKLCEPLRSADSGYTCMQLDRLVRCNIVVLCNFDLSVSSVLADFAEPS